VSASAYAEDMYRAEPDQNAVRRLVEQIRGDDSVLICPLLDTLHRRQIHVPIAYCDCTSPDVFVVGYGLDWNEQ
jgi:hypoxanthine-guanine phosphoribosyltransferase